jgi:hypothetical protein
LLAAQHGLEAFLHQLLPDPLNHGRAGLQRLDDPVVTPAFDGFGNVHLQQYTRLQQSLRRALAFSYQPWEVLASPLSRTTYFFTEISLQAMIVSVACVATESQHKILILAN